jgi:hypothetical protein
MKNRVFLCKKSFNDFEVGKFYKIEDEQYYLNKKHICINGQWFNEKNDDFIWPNLNDHFFTSQEERNIKLQVIDLKNKIT